MSEGEESDSSGSEKECTGYEEDESNDRDDDEIPSERFRRGGDIPSELDCGTSGSEDLVDEEEGDWNMMGAALERDFLGLD